MVISRTFFKICFISCTCLLLLTSCYTNADKEGKDNEDNNDNTYTVVYEEPGLSKYEEPVDLYFIRETNDFIDNITTHVPGETLNSNRWNQLYEEALGVRVHYKWTARGKQYSKKLDVAVASGEIADVVKVDAQQLRQLVNSDRIADLTTAYEQYATDFLQSTYLQNDINGIDSAIINGKLMGIPETMSFLEEADYIWIRTDWLEQLGLEPPKTMSDVSAISQAFTNRDPDQNGVKDTYGLATTSHLWDPVMGLSGFMAGYQAYPRLWIENEEGQLVFGGIQPEVRDALLELQRMYRDEELVDEFYLKDGSKVEQLVVNGKIGMFYGKQWGSFVAGKSRDAGEDAKWQAFPIVSNDGSRAKVPLKFHRGSYWVVRKDHPNPEALIKLFNLHLEKNWGKTAKFETYYNNTFPIWQISPVTPFPPNKNYDAFKQLEQARTSGDNSQLKGEPLFIDEQIKLALSGEESGWGWEKIYGANGAMSILSSYEKNGDLLYDAFTGAATEAMLDKETILSNLQHDVYVNIILGAPIEDFDGYVKDWLQLGGKQITDEVNEWMRSKQ